MIRTLIVVAAAAAWLTQSEGDKLRALFRESDEANLRRNPLSAIFRGDLRYADRLGDYCSNAYFEAEEAAARAELAALEKIDRAKLDATDRIAYDVFKYQQERALAGFDDDIFPLVVVPAAAAGVLGAIIGQKMVARAELALLK